MLLVSVVLMVVSVVRGLLMLGATVRCSGRLSVMVRGWLGVS